MSLVCLYYKMAVKPKMEAGWFITSKRDFETDTLSSKNNNSIILSLKHISESERMENYPIVSEFLFEHLYKTFINYLLIRCLTVSQAEDSAVTQVDNLPTS